MDEKLSPWMTIPWMDKTTLTIYGMNAMNGSSWDKDHFYVCA